MRRMVYNTGCSVSARGEIGYRSGFRFQRLGVQVPPGGPKKQDAAFAASCFFSPEGAEPPRNFAKQNAALFREGVRNKRRRQQRESAVRVSPRRLPARAQAEAKNPITRVTGFFASHSSLFILCPSLIGFFNE